MEVEVSRRLLRLGAVLESVLRAVLEGVRRDVPLGAVLEGVRGDVPPSEVEAPSDRDS